MEGLTASDDVSVVRMKGLLGTALLVLLWVPAACVHAAAGITAIIDSMPPGTWHELPNTRMSAVFPPKAGHPAWGVEGPIAVVKDWGGAAFDTKRNVFMITGGGHAAYGGNEVYEFSLADLHWRRVTDPSAYEPDPRFAGKHYAENYVRTLNGAPISSHTYDGLQYLPGLDKMFMFGGSQYRQGSNYDHHAYLFDTATMTWTRGAKAPGGVLEVASAWDSRRKRVLVVDRRGLMAYDPAADSWSTIDDGWYWQIGRTAAYSPDYDIFFMLGAENNKKPAAYIDFSKSNKLKAAPIQGDYPTYRVGLVYCQAIKKFVAWTGGTTVWTIDPRTWVSTAYSADSGPSVVNANGKPKNHGTYSRWQYSPDYNVFIGYNSANDNVWLYRLPEMPRAAAGKTTSAAVPSPQVRARTHSPAVANTPSPAFNAPSLPPPGRVVVAPNAAKSSFPPAGQLIMHSGAQTETTTPVAAVFKHENCGADLCVGPDYLLKRPSQAARIAQEGDTVYIEAGEYKDCTVWPVSVTIRGIHGRPKIGGKVCGGKAVWITKGAKTTISNVELHGALGGVSNAAAIRHEGKALIVRNVEIFNNHNGILSGHDPQMSVEVYDSVFHHMWTRGDLAHNIYVGKIGRFIAKGNYFYDGESGHFIKTLAAHSTIAYNRIIQKGKLNAALIDIWGCSKFEVVGNAMMRTGRYGAMAFIQLTPRTSNGRRITCPDTRQLSGLVAYNTVFFNNKLHNDPRWANLLHYNYSTPNVLVADNLVVHTKYVVWDNKGHGFAEHGGILKGNYHTKTWDKSLFVDPNNGDLRPTRALPGAAVSIDFVPKREPGLPVGTRPRANGHDVGAYAYQASDGR